MTTWPTGYGGELEIRGAARDLLTPTSATTPEVLDTAALLVAISAEKVVRAVSLEPGPADLSALVGASAGKGFRRAISEAFSSDEDRHSLGYFLS